MKYKHPANIAELEVDDIVKNRGLAYDEYKVLAALSDDEISDEQIAELEALTGFINELDGEAATREAAAEERLARIQAAKSAIAEPEAAEETDPEAEAAAAAEAEAAAAEEAAAAVIPDDASELVDAEKKEAVTASAKPGVRTARRNAPAPKIAEKATEDVVDPRKPAIVASADLRNIPAGSDLDMDGLTKAFIAKFSAMPKGRVNTVIQNSVATLHLNRVPEELSQAHYADTEDLIKFATDEKRLAGGKGLVAAGGWCAPSTTDYGIPTLETVDGILDMPEVGVTRGGISRTLGPDFETDIYGNADSFFHQTETEAEAGELKPIFDVTCPPFFEDRLEAYGWGLRAGILTNVAYPELVRRFVEGGLVAHAHRMNANVINALVAKLGAAENAGTAFRQGSAVSDSLSALEFYGERTRYQYRLAQTATLDGFAPIWLKNVFRQDLAYRNGYANPLEVSDAQITAWLALRKIRLQWVYDWQSLASNATDYPATVNVALYPAGTFIKGTSDVIQLDAIHDSVNTLSNEYTVIFFEEAMMVQRVNRGGVLVTLPLLDTAGRSGAANITGVIAA